MANLLEPCPPSYGSVWPALLILHRISMRRNPRLQVRIAAAQQLPALGRVLGEEGLRKGLLEELRQLLEDEEVQVRAKRPP